MPEMMNVVPAVDKDGDELWLDGNGDLRYVGEPSTVRPAEDWRRLYVKSKTGPVDRTAVQRLAESFDRIAKELGSLDDAREEEWRHAAKRVWGLLS